MTALFTPEFGERGREDLASGATLIPGWLTLEQQRWIVGQFREWIQGPVPIRAAKVRGHEMSVRTVAPVVSLSIGASCTFRFGNTENRGKPYTNLLLVSGDLFVFGGPSRLAYHGISKVHEGTTPEGCGLDHGRINITMRMTGLAG